VVAVAVEGRLVGVVRVGGLKVEFKRQCREAGRENQGVTMEMPRLKEALEVGYWPHHFLSKFPRQMPCCLAVP